MLEQQKALFNSWSFLHRYSRIQFRVQSSKVMVISPSSTVRTQKQKSAALSTLLTMLLNLNLFASTQCWKRESKLRDVVCRATIAKRYLGSPCHGIALSGLPYILVEKDYSKENSQEIHHFGSVAMMSSIQRLHGSGIRGRVFKWSQGFMIDPSTVIEIKKIYYCRWR